MAIEKMKKLRLMAVRTEKEDLLRDLLRLGCVEAREIDGDDIDQQLSSLVTKESSELVRYRAAHAGLIQTIGLLDRYAPAKGKLLSAKPETGFEELMDEKSLDEMLNLADNILGKEERIKRLSAEESRQRSAIESLTPWADFDCPLETEGTRDCALVLGGVPEQIEPGNVIGALSQAVEEAELFLVSSDKTQHYMALVCFRSDLAAALDALRVYGFAIASFSGLTGTASENIARITEKLDEIAVEKQELSLRIAAGAEFRDELKLCADRMSAKIACADTEDKLVGMKSTIVLQGWVLARSVPELEKLLDTYDCAWELEDPAPEEYPEVPVKLTNNKVTNALNMVTEMYSLPAYDGVDPNPLMAPFFILFYGLMMADMGYGILMVVAAVVALRKMKPKAGTLTFCELLLYAGISTFVMGALTGGFFGDALKQVGIIIGMPEGWGVLPSLFDPMKDSMMVLVGAMVLGLVHLNTGMVISVVEKVKKGDAAAAFWEEGSLWIILVGGVLMALCSFGVVNSAALATAGKAVLIAGVVMLFYGGSRSAKGWGKLLSVFSTLYNTATGWFGDILSYSRIMALMLAGSVIATVFNTIGGIAHSLWLFIPVFLVGHTLNFLLNLLSCYVHDLRLQCLEYFGKFYKDGGKAFRPLAVNTKYYDVVK